MKARIPDKEFQERILKTQEKMREKGFDYILCYGNEAEPQFVRYYSDYWPSFESAGVLIPANGEAILLIGPESGTFAKAHSRLKKIYKLLVFRESSEPEYPGIPLDTFSTVFFKINQGKNIKKLGIAGYSLISHTIYAELEQSLKKYGEVEIVRGDDLVSDIRAIKSQNEIACMKEAYRIAQEALKKVIDNIHVGMTENQIKGIALSEIFAQGGEGESYPFWIISGRGTNQAISRCRNRIVQEGDLIQIQIGARYEGYASTIGRPVVIGKTDSRIKAMIEAAFELQKEILDRIRPGINAGEIAQLQHKILSDRKMEKYILYGPCHGTGLMEGEYPWIEEDSDYILKENMTFSTCLYLGDDETETGIRVEDGFLITSDGTESFSDYRREVIELS